MRDQDKHRSVDCGPRGDPETWVFAVRQFLDGMVAIAAPVNDAKGRFIAALSFYGPTQRLTIADAIAKKNALQAAVLQLRSALYE